MGLTTGRVVLIASVLAVFGLGDAGPVGGARRADRRPPTEEARPPARVTPPPSPAPDAPGDAVTPPPALIARISDDRPGQALQIARADVHVVVRGWLAETTTTLTFRNHEPRALEGELVFPLPAGASVSGYALDVGGELVDGVVVAREQARVAFETEMRKGVDPGLVEWVRGNQFRTRVWPIPARGTRTVRVRYVSELLTRRHGAAREALYELPLRFTSPLDELTLAIEVVKGKAPEVRAGAPTGLRFERFDERHVARTTLRDTQPREDLVLALPDPGRDAVALERGEDGETYFAVDDFPEPAQVAQASRPRVVTLFWDASLSRCEADTARERGLIERFLRQVGRVELDVVVFRDAPEPVRTFDVRGGDGSAVVDYLRAAPCDGGTALGALRLPRRADFALLFSDGLGTLGAPPAAAFDAPLYTVSAGGRADMTLLAHLAERSGGAWIDLRRLSDEDALATLGAPVFRLLRAEYDPAALADVLPDGQPAVHGRFTLSGRLLRDAATLTLHYGRHAGAEELTRRFTLRRADAAPGRLVARAWAQRRVAALSLAPEANHDELLRLGRRFGIVTPGTSLLVLETLDQHLTYGVEPAATRRELRAAYLERLSMREHDEKARRARKLERVAEMWNRRVEWWRRELRHDPETQRPRIGEVDARREGAGTGSATVSRADADERRQRAAVPRAAPAAPAASLAAEAIVAQAEVAGSANGTVGTDKTLAKSEGEAEAAGRATIVLRPWDPDTPYLAALARAGRDGAYAVYLAQRETYGASPAFYLDCAEHFLRAGRRELALRVLTSVVELQLDEPRLLRVAAHRLQQLGALDLAVELFEDVLRLRPEEPQSLRDLALALEARADTARRAPGGRTRAVADYERAVELLYRLTLGEWDARFPEIEVLALEEANRILAVLARELGVAHPRTELDPRLRALLDVDVRIVLTWDTDATDMDLWVTEPTGERCNYSHALTASGGMISRDFTGGYGPEEYLVRRAVSGEYTVQANFYGSRAASLTGPTTVQATVITNYGRPNEERRALTLRLTQARDVVEVGRVRFEAPKVRE